MNASAEPFCWFLVKGRSSLIPAASSPIGGGLIKLGQGSTWAAGDVAQLLETDVELNSQGLLIWFARQRRDGRLAGVRS